MRRPAARRETQAVPHAAGVFFENFADRRAHRQFPQARVLHPAARAVQLGAAFAGAAQPS